MKKLLVLVATGFEDTELIASLDIFSRSSLDYELVSIENLDMVKGKVEAIVKTKKTKEVSLEEFSGIFLPGGPGHKLMLENDFTKQALNYFNDKKLMIAAICAAPDILIKNSIITNEVFTSHPGHGKLKNNTGKETEIDGHIITGRDFESSINFAKLIIEKI